MMWQITIWYWAKPKTLIDVYIIIGQLFLPTMIFKVNVIGNIILQAHFATSPNTLFYKIGKDTF